GADAVGRLVVLVLVLDHGVVSVAGHDAAGHGCLDPLLGGGRVYFAHPHAEAEHFRVGEFFPLGHAAAIDQVGGAHGIGGGRTEVLGRVRELGVEAVVDG